MLKVTWRNLVARKLRLLLSAFAIVLGVAFVAGSLIFTDAMGGAFDDIIEGSTADVEIAYQGANSWDSQQDSRTIPASVVDDLEKVPGVADVYPSTGLQSVFVVGADGKVVGGNGPPGLAFNPTGAKAITGKPIIDLVDGKLPDGPAQVALDVRTAQKAGYDIGDTVDLVTPGRPPTLKARLTGLVEFGSGGLNGATLSLFDLKYMQDAFFGGRDVFTSISLNAEPGVSQQQLAEAAQKVLPDGVVARTGDAVVAKNKAGIDQVLGFLNTFLLVFAAVSLVVGTFLIINTFSILVAQRSRELALLRAVGASRGQVNRSVLLEALAVGITGSTLGLGAGYLLALGLRALFGLFGLDLAGAHFPVEPGTVVASYSVGILVTLLAAYLPARRASRIAPVQALRDDVAMPESSLRARLAVGGTLVVLGAVGMAAGVGKVGGEPLVEIGLGMLAILVGVALLSPFAARPVIRGFGGAFRPFGTVGRLATENSLRNPRRTAATASALMIGLALVAMMSMLGRSASASADIALNKALTSQFVVSNVVGSPFSTGVAAEMRKVEGVQDVAALRYGNAKSRDVGLGLAAVDPRTFGAAFAVPTEAGSVSDLGPGAIVLAHDLADKLGVGVGDTIPVRFQADQQKLEVVAIMPKGATTPANSFVTFSTLAKGGVAPLDSYLFVTAEPGADLDAVGAALDRVVKDLPTVTVKDPQQFADEQKAQIDQLLNLIYGLLALSVVIAALGVLNTLALSVLERTREVGLLRAVGMSRRQVRTMVRLEAVVISVFGALLGGALGIAFGLVLLRALRDDGITEVVVPWSTLLAFVVAAGVVGVVAALLPARRAARLDVLRAITTE